MAHLVESMAYAGEVPWHGLGNKVDHGMTPDQMLDAAGINWSVSKRRAYTTVEQHVNNIYDPTVDSGMLLVPDGYFITRDSDNTVLSYCSQNYHPFQNADTMGFFKKFTEAGHMTMDTAGALKGGKEVWGLAKIATGFTLAGGDEVTGYLLMNNSHVPGKAMLLLFTAIRVVCNNTLQLALSQKATGKGFKVPHMQMFDAEIVQSAEEALGLSTAQMKDFKDKAKFLASKPAKDFDVNNWIAEITQPKLLIERAKMDAETLAMQPPIHEQFARTARTISASIAASPGAELRSARGTWWGALNGLTYAVDHKRNAFGEITDNALHSAWFGTGASLKRLGLEKALEYAK